MSVDAAQLVEMLYASTDVPPCQWRHGCTQAATHAGVQLCPHRHQVNLCESHQIIGARNIERGVADGKTPRCNRCDDILIHPYIIWRPL